MRVRLSLKQALKQSLLPLAFMVAAPTVLAGGGGDLVPAPYHEEVLNQISMREAEMLLSQPGVIFYDVNTLEIWGDGFIPGAIYFNVNNWKTLLPENKDTTMVFYCANRLCTASNVAAREVMKLGYTDVRQMPDGIYGWRISGRPIERP
ncbi:rhodanese-related sulfurtransferase [Shewanella chilikensis]|jgi:rhodanese-related sulfurtransferase|uniref:Rhodanese-like domain-containing protein n=2 Tax=Shewanellaceae TaxID=267890 RepID=A0A6G7LWI4_9GAMM|nr:sulfurtransferase [Shewanella sp.]PYE60672.1 rhodanese-related sulfurtransferase [Shewanella chilikensis]QIJ05995.1 rhodanese-like domain-containing protein [Shewanella chilikensis]GGZ43114.1 sulfurtransferase [Shewanella chilikensis]HCD14655.1 rhodanese-like domain-containing protein [Shewanella sp.]